METKNHMQLAWYVGKRKKLNKVRVCIMTLGSIFPDINILSYLRGHTYENSFSMIQRKMRNMSKQKNKNFEYYWNLGIIQHYIADYFTHPHNRKFCGSLSEHCEYEKQLRYEMKKCLEFWEKERIKKELPKNIDEIFVCIEEQHRQYSWSDVSLKRDCRYIIGMVEYVVAAMLCLEEKDFSKESSVRLIKMKKGISALT